MKQITLILFLVLSTLGFAQEGTAIIKKWNLTEIEEFGSKYPPTDPQANDFIEFSVEKKYNGIINGQAVEGSWAEKTGKYTLSPNKEKSAFKVNWIRLVSVDADSLVLIYQSEDLIKTTLLYKQAE